MRSTRPAAWVRSRSPRLATSSVRPTGLGEAKALRPRDSPSGRSAYAYSYTYTYIYTVTYTYTFIHIILYVERDIYIIYCRWMTWDMFPSLAENLQDPFCFSHIKKVPSAWDHQILTWRDHEISGFWSRVEYLGVSCQNHLSHLWWPPLSANHRNKRPRSQHSGCCNRGVAK